MQVYGTTRGRLSYFGLIAVLTMGITSDVRVLNYSSLGFRHAASGGLLLFARDDEVWYNFREETWIQYLDFAPLARQMLLDLLGASP
jgi:hypothetical protein